MSRDLSKFLGENLNDEVIEKVAEQMHEKVDEEIIEIKNEIHYLDVPEKESAKDMLLDEVKVIVTAKKSLDFGYFIYVLLALTFAFMFVFPKIYIQQQIYFKSREISKLKSEYDTLKEENRLISTSVETIKFKNQILDTLF